MNTEWYQKMCDRAQKLLKNELSYGFVSTIIWEVAKKGVNEINFDRILEISSKIIESAPRELSKEERGDLLYTISEFDKEIEAKVALLSADADRVKSYVFESPRLPEMRGASLILEDLNKSYINKSCFNNCM